MPRLSPTSLFTGLLAAGLMLPAAASAQDDLKPEVMLMIDGSRLMGKTLSLNDPVCEPAGASSVSAWRGQTPHTPINLVKEALLGTIEAPRDVQWCTVEGAPERNQHEVGPDEDHGHARQMCCAQMNGADCQAWLPCYNDNGLRFDQEDAVSFDDPDARTRDGLIDANIDQIKFGVMFTDGNLDQRTGRDGHYSYGDENKTLPNGQRINVGTRKFAPAGNLHVGALIAPHKWFYNDGGNLDAGEVGDDNERVRRHNKVVQQVVGRLVPHGVAPLSAFVRDAEQYYQANDAECRERSVILITRGYDSVLAEGRAPGFPYDPAVVHAARLRAQGVTLHVVLVAPEGENETRVWAERVASAGGGQAVRADTASDLRRVINKVARSSVVGRQTRTRPLVVSATTADYCDNGFPCAIEDDDTLQWRINAYSELSNGTAYGRISATELSCDDDLQDPQRPGVPQARAATIDYDKVLRERGNRSRRSISVRGDREEAIVLTGGEQPVFHDNGAVLFDERDALATFMGVPRQEIDDDANGNFQDANAADDDPDDRDADGAAVEDVPAAPRRVRAAGLLVNGFFGARGLGEGARRQLGAILTSDLVALRAPALGLNDPGYLAYRNAQQQRKTVVAAGARDGLIHFFRANDGVEVLTYMPGSAWGEIIEAEAPVDGPLGFADIVPCRALNGGGNQECPDELRFEAWLFGGAGREAANVFGVRLSAAQSLADDPNRPLNLEEDVGPGGAWDRSADDLGNPGLPELTLGAAVSRPAVTHVRDGNRVRAALIMGCGKGEGGGSTGPGRCVLVLEAVTGRVIRRFDLFEDGAQFGAAGEVNSFTGSPVVYPAGGITPASRAYIGDAVGRIWRIDMRDLDPNRWSIDVAWPPQGDEAGDYVLGRAIVDRPSVALRPDGALVVTFATDRAGEIDADRTSFAVSFTDRTVIDEDAGVTYQVTRNWLLPFSDGEYATGSPVVRDETTYITTRQGNVAGGCSAPRGRLYGLHYYKKYLDAEGNEATFVGADGKVTDARPSLAQFDDDGPAGESALSIILPPGRVAYGLAIARTPSCSAEAAATTSIVLNLADEQPGAQAAAAGAVEQAKVEVVQGGNVVERPLDGAIFMRGSDVALEICIDCDKEGRPAQGLIDNAAPPFPTQVVYWGSTFLN